MWITGLCSFPPLIGNTAFPLNKEGSTVSAHFTVPVDKNYQFVLEFEFSSTQARLQDKIVGNNYQTECDKNPEALTNKPDFGHPIPIRVVIRKAQDRSVVTDETITSLCMLGHGDYKKTRGIAWVTLTRGNYIAEVTNLIAQDGLENVKIFLALVPGEGK